MRDWCRPGAGCQTEHWSEPLSRVGEAWRGLHILRAEAYNFVQLEEPTGEETGFAQDGTQKQETCMLADCVAWKHQARLRVYGVRKKSSPGVRGQEEGR
ncbi:hypothetical protein NDU88_004568 [Pleurodeles waltl]|uniref:Uncharacterized protein n=1 Tax=Pleurodeles waltl TaxID=8319 RepID=A0AAV7NSV3_PLEWA|nr:hypothetical protein NDU88_004568 [Pleurodeles waltl]